MKKKDYVVNERGNGVNEPANKVVDLEEALDIAGAGKYQMFHGALMLASLSGAMLEMTGYGYILPAAACDLQLSTATKGLIASIPHLGVILTDAFWGSLTDSRGRKPILLLSCAVSGLIGLTSAFMPDLTSFAICKLIGSLLWWTEATEILPNSLSCPSGLGFAYACELTPRRRRDVTVLLCNGLLMLSTVYSILFSWGIMRTGWHLDVGVLNIRPWRILTALHALPLILTAIWMTQAKESPKFLMVKGKEQEAIDVLRHIYHFNTGLPADSYPVLSLRKTFEDLEEIRKEKECDGSLSSKIMNSTLVQLLRPPHLKWLALTGFLTFGMFSTLVGLSVFAPDITSKAMSAPAGADETVCVLINQIKNVTEPTTCKDNLTNSTFVIMLISCVLYGSIITVIGLTPMSKRYQLIGTYVLVATACLTSGLLRTTHIAVWFISSLQLTSLCIGPLNAYTVQIFPTGLRGTAVGVTAMFGRAGCVVGTTTVGYLLATSCSSTFYSFSTLLFTCAALSLLLPKDQPISSLEGQRDNKNDENKLPIA